MTWVAVNHSNQFVSARDFQTVIFSHIQPFNSLLGPFESHMGFFGVRGIKNVVTSKTFMVADHRFGRQGFS